MFQRNCSLRFEEPGSEVVDSAINFIHIYLIGSEF
jgi:hypothetical protein